MARRPFDYDHANYIKGMRRDASGDDAEVSSMRTIKNYRYLYNGDEAKLKVRQGYTRYNETALADVATQLFWFRDQDGNENLMGIVDGKWYVIKATGSHVELSDETATAPCPVVQHGNRVFFGTDGAGDDIGWRWTDNNAIGGANKSYRAGIIRPTEGMLAVPTAAIGHSIAATGSGLVLNTTTQYKIGIKFVLTATLRIASISISVMKPTALALSGNVRIGIYTESGSEPSSTLAHDDAVSDWWPVMAMPVRGAGALADTLKRFVFGNSFELDAGNYWIVMESDSDYRTNYIDVPGTQFYLDMGHDAPGVPTYAYTQFYDNVAGSWGATAKEAYFQVGGLDDSLYYDYVITYYNSTYGIESRPSDKTRVDPTGSTPTVTLSFPNSGDPQVDKVRVYRRDVTNIDDEETDITDTYKFVGEFSTGSSYVDTVITAYLGAVLQTTDHYCHDESDDTGGNIRTAALQPFVATFWKGRVVFVERNSNILHFSKRLGMDGATGQTGDQEPDFFPLENRQEMDRPSDIIGLEILANDELAVYFKDESISIVSGMNQVLNPPPDIGRRLVTASNGLFAAASLQNLRGRHVYMSSEGLRVFNGSPDTEHVSFYIQSIFDAIEAEYLDDTKIAVFGDEVWVLVDTDNDGTFEHIYIVDLQRPELPWRFYEYDVSFNDIVVRRTGSTFRSLFAADDTNAYVLELESGTDDNGIPIKTEQETHDLDVSGRVTITNVETRGYSPNAVAGYDVTLTDHEGDTRVYEIDPKSNQDIRGHSTGTQFMSSYRMRVKLESATVDEDEFFGFGIKGLITDR